MEASRKPESCDEEFQLLVGEAKSAADAWLSATSRAFDLWAARRLAAAKPVKPPQLVERAETDGFLALLSQESAAFARRKPKLGNTLVLERTSRETGGAVLQASDELGAVLHAVEEFRLVEPQTKSQEEAVQTLIRSLQSARSADSAHFHAIYDTLDSDVRRRCEARPGTGNEDPFALPSAPPKQGRRTKAIGKRE